MCNSFQMKLILKLHKIVSNARKPFLGKTLMHKKSFLWPCKQIIIITQTLFRWIHFFHHTRNLDATGEQNEIWMKRTLNRRTIDQGRLGIKKKRQKLKLDSADVLLLIHNEFKTESKPNAKLKNRWKMLWNAVLLESASGFAEVGHRRVKI